MGDRATLHISPRSWHGRLYGFWRQHAKFKARPSYRENLCHYCRVVLFWAPLAWFVHASLARNDDDPIRDLVRPSSVTAVLAVITGVILAFVLAPAGTLLSFGIAGAFIGAVAVCATIISLTEERVDWWMSFWRGAWKYVLRPPLYVIAAVGAGIGWCFVQLFRGLGKLGQGIWVGLIRWWAKPFYRHVLIPTGGHIEDAIDWLDDHDGGPILVLTALGGGVLTVLGLLFASYTFIMVLVVAALAASLVTGFFIFLTRNTWKNMVLNPTASFTRIVAERAVSKKHGICPFIEIDQAA